MNIPICIDKQADSPLYRQLYDSLLHSIKNGALQPGEMLPATRELAESLQVSRITVLRTYEELLNQGYLEATIGSGTFVSRHLERSRDNAFDIVDHLLQAENLSQFGQWSLQNPVPEPIDCHIDGQSNLLPLKQWRQIMLRHCRLDDPRRMQRSQETFGYRPLREAVCAYLKRTKALNCSADQIAIFSGSQQALNLVARVLVDAGDVVVVENPGSLRTRETFLAHRASLRTISVDEYGARVRELHQIKESVKAVCISPSHQDPTGALLPVSRRQELLDWASEHNSSIIENDTDCHYRYGGAPLHSIQGMRSSASVFYISNFSQLLFPITTIGFLVVPRHYVPIFERAKAILERDFSVMEQGVLADFINDGHLERYLRATRAVYTKRRQALLYALTKAFLRSVRIARESAGTHVLVKFFSQLSDEQILEHASRCGIKLISPQACYMDDHEQGLFLVSFAQVKPDSIMPATLAFANLILPN